MSFAAYSILMSRGERPFVGIPVFVSRMFRHGCVFVRTDGDIAQPEDLAGARVGIPEYQMTAVVWMQGILDEYHGVDPKGSVNRGGVMRRADAARKCRFAYRMITTSRTSKTEASTTHWRRARSTR